MLFCLDGKKKEKKMIARIVFACKTKHMGDKLCQSLRFVYLPISFSAR